jgi:hypothetical protein
VNSEELEANRNVSTVCRRMQRLEVEEVTVVSLEGNQWNKPVESDGSQ